MDRVRRGCCVRFRDIRLALIEKFLAFVQAFFALRGTQAPEARATSVEYGAGREPQLHQIVTVLPGKNQIVLAAIETPAEKWAALVDGAA